MFFKKKRKEFEEKEIEQMNLRKKKLSKS